MTITAISADGVVHQFPDETDQSVIDDTMKRYAQWASNPGSDPSQPYQVNTAGVPSGSPNAAGRGTLRLTLPDGRTGTVAVDNSFGSLSPDQQHATIDEITRSIPSQGGFVDDLQAGASGAMDATGAAFQGVGGIMSRNGVPGGDYVSGAGDWLQAHAPAVPEGYHSRSGDILSDIGQGNYSRAAGDVVHGVVEGVPVAAGAIGAGAALDAVGIPAAAGAALVGGITGLGAGAEGRATAAGRATPNTDDVVGALPRAAVDALSSGATFGRLPIGVAGRVAAGAAAGAGQSAVDQYDTTGTIDPTQVGNAAITTGATVGASELPGMAAWGTKAVSDRAMAATLDKPASTDDAASILRVKADMDAIRANAVTTYGSAPADTHIANSVKSEYAKKLNGIAQSWLRAGLIDRDDYRDLSTLVNNQALRHNNTIAEGTDELPTLFSQVDALDNVPDAARATFKDGVRDLNTVSTQSFIKNTVGPIQRIAQFAGKWVPAAASLSVGNPLAAAAAVMGHGVTGKIAGAVGAKIDQALGLNTPPVVLQAINAVKALRAVGIDPATVKGSLPALQGISGRSMPTSTVTGLPTNSVPVNTPLPASAPSQLPPGWRYNPSIGNGGSPPQTPQAPTAPVRMTPGMVQARDGVGYNEAYRRAQAENAANGFTSPGLQPNTPDDVANALSQDDASTPTGMSAGPIDPIAAARLGASINRLQGDSTKPAEAPAASPATTLPANPQTTPTDSLSLPASHPSAPLWEQLAASGDPTITRRQIREAADKVYPDDMIAALDATRSFSSDDQAQTVLQPIRDRLQLDGIGIRNVQPETPPADSASAAQGTFTPGSRYIANVVPGMDHAGAVEAARAAEAAGRVPAGTADMIDRSPAPIDPRIAQAVQQHALEQIGIPTQGPRNPSGQWAVDRTNQARMNAMEYHNNARALAR